MGVISAVCPSCGLTSKVDDSRRGQFVKCRCGSKFKVGANDFFGGESAKAGPVVERGGAETGLAATVKPRFIAIAVVAAACLVGLIVFGLRWYDSYVAQTLYIEAHNAYVANHHNEAYEKFKKCLEMRPGWYAPYIRIAPISVEKGNLEEARKFYNKVAEMASAPALIRAAAHAGLATLALMGPNPNNSAAEGEIMKAYSAEPRYLPARVTEAAILLSKGRADEAYGKLEGVEGFQILRELTKPGQALMFFIRMCVGASRGDIGLYTNGLSLFTSAGASPDLMRTSERQLLQLLSSSDGPLDDSLYQIARALSPEGYEADERPLFYQAMAGLHLRAGNLEAAGDALEQAMKGGAQDTDKLYALLQLWRVAFKKKSDAVLAGKISGLYVRLASDAAYLKRMGPPFTYEALNFLEAAHETEEAGKVQEAALKAFPDDPALMKRRGAYLLKEGQYAASLDVFEKLLQKKADGDVSRVLESYRKKPLLSEFRPSSPAEYSPKPLIHLRVESGSPFPLEAASVIFELDGRPVKPVQSGDEYFYLPSANLAEGAHIFKSQAKDKLANSAQEEFRFAVDSTAPAAEINSVELAAPGAAPVVTLHIADSDSAVDYHSIGIRVTHAPDSPEKLFIHIAKDGEFLIDDRQNRLKRGQPVPEQPDFTFSVPGLSKSGIYQLVVNVSDICGNSAERTLKMVVK